MKLLDYLYVQPVVNAVTLKDRLGLSAPTVQSLLSEFEKDGLIREKTGQKRNRIFEYFSYLSLFEEGTGTGDQLPLDLAGVADAATGTDDTVM